MERVADHPSLTFDRSQLPVASMPSTLPDWTFETAVLSGGARHVAGIDEAGRGPLAGPVVAAAVILAERPDLPGLNDSKKLSAKRREELFAAIVGNLSNHWAIGVVSPAEIDAMNILRATWLAMRRAAEGLAIRPQHYLIDGLPVQGFPFPYTPLVKGDSRSLSIAAASIIAKVSRDRIMAGLDRAHPHYGFAKHSGYGTKQHLEALRRHGPCEHHRRSFQPIAQLSLPLD
jgi:ribonuclease HII